MTTCDILPLLSLSLVVFSGINDEHLAAATETGTKPAFNLGRYTQQERAIVSIYSGQNFMCHGTLVSPTVAIVPCSCIVTVPDRQEVTYSRHGQIYGVNLKSASMHTAKLSITDGKGSNAESSQVSALQKHEYCNNYFDYDYGMVNLTKPFEGSTLAWVSTTNPEVLREAIQSLLITNIIEGDCHVVTFVAHPNHQPGLRAGKPIPVIFQRFDMCVNTVCDLTGNTKNLDATRCFGNFTNPDSGETISGDFPQFDELVTWHRMCIRSRDNSRLCNLASGLPVFCNVEEVRGSATAEFDMFRDEEERMKHHLGALDPPASAWKPPVADI